ncbi:MAG: dihydrofolate reductase family protein [Galactobacter sp.]
MQRLFPPSGSGGPAHSPNGESDGARHRFLSDADLLAEAAAPTSGSFVRFSMVSTLDGRISVDGVSAPLSSAADSRRFHLLRCAADAVVVGAGTALAEGYRGQMLPKPMQEIRTGHGRSPLPTTVVLSASGSIPTDAPVLTDAPAPTIVVVSDEAPHAKRKALSSALGTDAVVTVGPGANPHDITAALAARGLLHLHHEGGPTVLSRYLSADAMDSLCLTLAPSILMSGPSLVPDQASLVLRDFSLHTLYEEDSVLLADYRRLPNGTETVSGGGQ